MQVLYLEKQFYLQYLYEYTSLAHDPSKFTEMTLFVRSQVLAAANEDHSLLGCSAV
jgi:hypothetical protein